MWHRALESGLSAKLGWASLGERNVKRRKLKSLAWAWKLCSCWAVTADCYSFSLSVSLSLCLPVFSFCAGMVSSLRQWPCLRRARCLVRGQPSLEWCLWMSLHCKYRISYRCVNVMCLRTQSYLDRRGNRKAWENNIMVKWQSSRSYLSQTGRARNCFLT